MTICPNILLDKLFHSYFTHICAQEFSLHITRVDVHVSMRLPAKLRAHFRIRPNSTKTSIRPLTNHHLSHNQRMSFWPVTY